MASRYEVTLCVLSLPALGFARDRGAGGVFQQRPTAFRAGAGVSGKILKRVSRRDPQLRCALTE